MTKGNLEDELITGFWIGKIIFSVRLPTKDFTISDAQ